MPVVTKLFDAAQTGLTRSALNEPVIMSDGFWGELRVFLAVAKFGSLTRAGLALRVSTPTISRRVKRLQDHLKAQLVVLSGGGAKLTPDGRRLAQALVDLDLRVYEIAHDFRQKAGSLRGIVRLSVTEGLAGVFLASKMAEFNQRYPDIELHLKTPINLTDMRENKVDLMIGYDDAANGEMSAEPLGYLHLIPVASESYLSRNGIPEKGRLERHLFVDSHFYQARNEIWQGWQSLVAQGRRVGECDSSLSYGMAIISGLGIGLLGNYVLADRSLRPLHLGVHVRVPIFLIGLRERLSARPVRIVRDWVADTFSAGNPCFSPELNLETSPQTPFVQTMHVLRGAR
jgi:DNA-binding transcriptional LysR family regulator